MSDQKPMPGYTGFRPTYTDGESDGTRRDNRFYIPGKLLMNINWMQDTLVTFPLLNQRMSSVKVTERQLRQALVVILQEALSCLQKISLFRSHNQSTQIKMKCSELWDQPMCLNQATIPSLSKRKQMRTHSARNPRNKGSPWLMKRLKRQQHAIELKFILK